MFLLLFLLLFEFIMQPVLVNAPDLVPLEPRENVKQSTNLGQTNVAGVSRLQFPNKQHVHQDNQPDHHETAEESNDRITVPPHAQGKHRTHHESLFQNFEVNHRHQDGMIQAEASQQSKSDTGLWNKDGSQRSTDSGKSDHDHSVHIRKWPHKESTHSLFPPTQYSPSKSSKPIVFPCRNHQNLSLKQYQNQSNRILYDSVFTTNSSIDFNKRRLQTTPQRASKHWQVEHVNAQVSADKPEKWFEFSTKLSKRPARIKREDDPTPLRNVALNKPAWMSSISSEQRSTTNANDGSNRTHIRYCVRTNYRELDLQEYRWWRTDMLAVYQIFYVRITNRGDCCGYRLKKFYINLAVEMYDPNDVHLYPEEKCVYREKPVPLGATIRLDCDKPVLGRYLTLLMKASPEPGDGYNAPLNFCELEAYGQNVTVLKLGSLCGLPNQGPTICEKNATCSNWRPRRCKIRYGHDCNEPRKFHQCLPDSLCNEGVCRINYTGDCTHRREWCRSGTFCQGYACKMTLGESCRGDLSRWCAEPYYCDSLGYCKKLLGVGCSSDFQCLSGASCKVQGCLCNTENAVTNSSIRKCVPKPGRVASKCTKDSECIDRNAVCETGICQCRFHPTLATNYTCDDSVSCFSDDNCGFGNVCENPGTAHAVCALGLGRTCPSEGRNCTKGTKCDGFSFSCKLVPKEDCSHTPTMCITGADCENGKTCQMRVDEQCSADDECISGAQCDAAAENVCRLRVGAMCERGRRTKCVSHALCNADNVCKLKVGESCQRSELCMHGSVCDSASNECRLKNSEDCSGRENDCMKDAVCDVLHMCGVKSGSKCKPGFVRECVSGASCVPSAEEGSTTCQCNTAVATGTQNGTCEPSVNQVGHSCKYNFECTSPNAHCVNRTCACEEGFILDTVDFGCKVRPGGSCDSDKDNCVSGSVCSLHDVCELGAGQSCAGENRGRCMVSTNCEDEVCRLIINEDCSGVLADLCGRGVVCDSLHKCRLPVGSACTKATVGSCVAGSICEEGKCQCDQDITLETTGKACAPKGKKVGGSCTLADGEASCDDANSECIDGVCQCVDGYGGDESFTCKKVLGEDCEPGENECRMGTVCELDVCKNDLGSSCNTSRLCVSGTVCDNTHTCSLDAGGNCSADRERYCRSGTICDNVFHCGISVGDVCSGLHTHGCVSGAECVNGTCTCNLEVAKSLGLLCEPLDGRVGGLCSPVKPCEDSLARCEDDVCRCHAPAVVVRADFSCTEIADSGNFRDTVAILVWILVVHLFGGMLLGAVYFYWKRKGRADAKPSVLDELRARRDTLSRLSREAQAVVKEKKPTWEEPSMTDDGTSVSIGESSVA